MNLSVRGHIRISHSNVGKGLSYRDSPVWETIRFIRKSQAVLPSALMTLGITSNILWD